MRTIKTETPPIGCRVVVVLLAMFTAATQRPNAAIFWTPIRLVKKYLMSTLVPIPSWIVWRHQRS